MACAASPASLAERFGHRAVLCRRRRLVPRRRRCRGCWPQIASANWLACVRHCALALQRDSGVLVDIGSTTTDLIAFHRGNASTRSRSDAQRLASGELVYQGVVRTPLCALAQRVDWRGRA